MEKDPFTAFNFRLELGDIAIAGFSECTGLSIQTELSTYREGGRNEGPLIFPAASGYGNITLKRGMTWSNELIEWQLNVVHNRKTRKDLAIVLKNEKKIRGTVKRWLLCRALPVRWTGPELKAASSELAIESLELAHEGLVQV